MSQTIRAWKDRLQQPSPLPLAQLDELLSDARAGVRKLAQRYLKEQAYLQKEAQRVDAMWRYEREGWSANYQQIAGIDEAGRGPLAGPVVAAAVILPRHFDATGLNDSKKLSIQQRERCKQRIEAEAISIGVGRVDVAYIDRYNILQAVYQAMRLAIQQLTPPADYLLVDALTIPALSLPQRGIINGDSLSHSVAAASVIAKTTRDEWMKQAAAQYPQYGFEQHMGYGTPAHLAALQKWGPSPIHRRSFAPVCKWQRSR
jgi:ribonuclease HII